MKYDLNYLLRKIVIQKGITNFHKYLVGRIQKGSKELNSWYSCTHFTGNKLMT